VDDGQWVTATAESISAALKQQADAKPKEQQVLANSDNPTSTWIVKTKQGGVAILKVEYRKDILTDTSGIVEGFIVRYKLAATAQKINEEVQADEAKANRDAKAHADNQSKDAAWTQPDQPSQPSAMKPPFTDGSDRFGGSVSPVLHEKKTTEAKPKPNPSTANASSMWWGDESNGLRCRIVPVSPSMDAEQFEMSTPWTRFESPDEITFAIEIKNVSGKPIKLKDFRYETGFASETKAKLNSNHYAPHLFEFAFTDRDGQVIARSQREFTVDALAMILSDALLTNRS